MNQVGILCTNGGTHSPEKWAAASAGQLIQIAAEATGEQAIAGRRLELQLLDILERHHKIVQDEEKLALKEEGVAHYEHPIDVSNHVFDAFDEIMSSTKSSHFAEHFSDPIVQGHVLDVIRKDMQTIIEIERAWHKSKLLGMEIQT